MGEWKLYGALTEFRFWLSGMDGMFVVLSTFIIACPASLTDANPVDIASVAFSHQTSPIKLESATVEAVYHQDRTNLG